MAACYSRLLQLHVPDLLLALQAQTGDQLKWFNDDGSVNRRGLGTYVGKAQDKALQGSLSRLLKVFTCKPDEQARVG